MEAAPSFSGVRPSIIQRRESATPQYLPSLRAPHYTPDSAAPSYRLQL
jgi:hypothetical protein